jgi:hypothetical protein
MEPVNIEYVNKLFSRNLWLGNAYLNEVPFQDKQVVNTKCVLYMADSYNRLYASTDTNFRNQDYATLQIADTSYTNYIADNFLLGRYFFTRNKTIRGDQWGIGTGGDNNKCDTRIETELYENCFINFSFDYFQNKDYGTIPMWIRIKNSNGPILLLTGYYQRNWPKYNVQNGKNNFTVALEKGTFIEIGVTGDKTNTTGTQFGVISNLNVRTLLKSNEVYIHTPLVLSAKDYTTDQEFPIVETALYNYSFFVHNQNYDSGSTNYPLIKFSYIYKGIENVLFEGSSIPDEAREYQVEGTVNGMAGGVFWLRVGKLVSNNDYGIVDCLTIKGTK